MIRITIVRLVGKVHFRSDYDILGHDKASILKIRFIRVGYVIVKDFCQVSISFSLACYIRVFFGPFWRPIFGRVPNAKKYVFFPIWIRKFPIQGTKKTGEKITKYRHFTMFMFVVERAGPNSPNDTREITKYCKLPNGNVPLRQFSRIYSRRCRGVCNKHTWFILLVPYSGVLI